MTDPQRSNAKEGATAPSNDPPPTRPQRPDDEDCCGQGCVPCIFDLYDEAMGRYREELAAWKERHPGESPE
ncbi:oxidoreductase-like domain-containing protein [Dyella amyloliquefaciens]|uniref:oxidoreductase-like domain-containing protein n=1 Tax=Dyella amyloliquefaciens TaxID=1770545 RepID=UPI00102ECA79|nr:oxidoreductase-like domain-containing protein [Dyella amyloliquefaciens]